MLARNTIVDCAPTEVALTLTINENVTLVLANNFVVFAVAVDTDAPADARTAIILVLEKLPMIVDTGYLDDTLVTGNDQLLPAGFYFHFSDEHGDAAEESPIASEQQNRCLAMNVVVKNITLFTDDNDFPSDCAHLSGYLNDTSHKDPGLLNNAHDNKQDAITDIHGRPIEMVADSSIRGELDVRLTSMSGFAIVYHPSRIPSRRTSKPFAAASSHGAELILLLDGADVLTLIRNMFDERWICFRNMVVTPTLIDASTSMHNSLTVKALDVAQSLFGAVIFLSLCLFTTETENKEEIFNIGNTDTKSWRYYSLYRTCSATHSCALQDRRLSRSSRSLACFTAAYPGGVCPGLTLFSVCPHRSVVTPCCERGGVGRIHLVSLLSFQDKHPRSRSPFQGEPRE
jgi:hypothetical protein